MMDAAVLEEYHAVRREAGLIEGSAWGAVEVRGADRAAFLHNLLTQDIKSLAPGAAAEAALVTPAAKWLAHLVVLAETDAHWLIAHRERIDTVLKTLDHYLITEDVTLADRRGSHAALALQGPRSPAILQGLIPRQGSGSLGEDPEASGRGTGRIRQAAYSFTGEPGAMLIVPVEEAPALRAQCREHGAAPVGWDAAHVLRIEAGIPWDGSDMDESNLLPETGLESRAVSDTKGCYVGQEVIARLRTYGSVSRRLMGLVCDGTTVPQPKDAISKDGESVGEVTSACLSPALGRPIALGYVKRPHYEAETSATILRGGTAIPARLALLPFIRSRSGPAPAGGTA